jgi:hypothetical protein
MQYLFTPPNTHYDGGLGATADQFSTAAESLEKNDSSMAGVLPKSYLQRHALELWFKSFIVIIHKKFNIPYGVNFSQAKPAILVNGKWKSLSNTHNLSELYSYFHNIYESNKTKVPEGVNWDFPDKIEKQVKLVSGSDPKSTYFRYPESSNETQDSKKATVQKESLELMMENSKKSGKAFKAFICVDSDYNVQESFNIGTSPLPAILKALKELNDFFKGVHVAFRVNLTNGK